MIDVTLGINYLLNQKRVMEACIFCMSMCDLLIDEGEGK